MSLEHSLSRRERQIMSALYRIEYGSVSSVVHELGDRSHPTTVRTLLGRLFAKGYLKRRLDGTRYIYFPRIAHETAAKEALSRVVETYFSDRPSEANAALTEVLSTLNKET